MAALTFLLLERCALLLVGAFALTRVRAFRHLLRGAARRRWLWLEAGLFALFAALGSELGVDVPLGSQPVGAWSWRPGADVLRVGPDAVATVIGGLLGGPWIGGVAGALAGIWRIYMGGAEAGAAAVAAVLTGVLAGWTARFFAQEGILPPPKAVFVGLFAPVLYLGLVLAFAPAAAANAVVAAVNRMGLPLVIADSLAVGVFSAIVGVARLEEEQTEARAMQRALAIADKALPLLRWALDADAAARLAGLLRLEARVAAVAVCDGHHVLAHDGEGCPAHQPGTTPAGDLAEGLAQGVLTVVRDPARLGCADPDCPLTAAVLVPLRDGDERVGAVILYWSRGRVPSSADIELARGLARLLSREIRVARAEMLRGMIQEMRLRHLQAQVHPHFLFNTLHLISGLIRMDPDLARHLVVRLAQFLRLSLQTTSHRLVPLAQDLDMARAYADIVAARFGARIRITWHVDEAALDAVVPPGTLQPLVENSVKHGLAAREDGGRIDVMIRLLDERVRIEVRDDGVGFPEAVLSGETPGIGLSNVRQRLEALLGADCTLHLENLAEGGVRVWCEVPLHTGEEVTV